MCIGIGVNINIAPQINEQNHYESTCLKEILNKEIIFFRAKVIFVETLQEELLKLESKDILCQLEKYMTPKNTLWKHKETNKIYQDCGLNDEGYLLLKSF